VARADRFPRVSLTALLGLESAELKDLATSRALTWSLGAGIVAPLVNGGRLKAAEAQAWASLREAEAQWMKAAQGAFRDVADALVFVRRSREVTAQQLLQTRARARSMELAGLRFEGGLSSYFEVLDAQRDLFPAELLAAAAKRDEMLAVVGLYRALGGGWEQQGACPAGPSRCAPAPCPCFPPPSPCSPPPAAVPPAGVPAAVLPAGVPAAVLPAGVVDMRGHVPSTLPQAPPPAPPVAAKPASAADLGAPPAGVAAPPFPASPSR
jgi:multidrug efflux system outer membrane protein